MSFNYEDIKNTNVIYGDSREQDRLMRFKNCLDEFLDGHNKTKFEKMGILKDKKNNGELYFQNVALEYGDYAFNDVVVEFKNYEDFKTCVRGNILTKQVEELYMHSGFKDCALVVVCDDFNHFWNEKPQWKGVVRFNSKINVFVVPSEEKAFEFILHFFWLGGRHLSQPPRSIMKSNANFAMNLLWATRVFSYNQVHEIIKKTGISTIPQLLDLFGSYTPKRLQANLGVRGVTEKKIGKCQSILEGRVYI